MRKVLFVGPDLNEIGGVSIYCKAILDTYPGEIEYFPFPLRMKRNPALFLAVLFRFVGKISAEPGLLIHLNTSLNLFAIIRDGLFLLLSLLFSHKTFVFIHGWRPSFQQSLTGWRRALFRAIFNRASAVFVLAGHFQETLRDWGFSTEIVVETTCFPPELFDAGDSHVRMPSQQPRILFLARIVREKGAFELIDACRSLKQDLPELRLDIAGDGPDVEELKHYSALNQMEFVTFHGAVAGPEKYALFKEATLFCLPSYTEGLPITILEAMFFGLPIVTTGVGGIADIFANGTNGFLVEPRNVPDLKERLRLLCLDLKTQQRMSAVNADYALSRFAPRAVARRLAAFHESRGVV